MLFKKRTLSFLFPGLLSINLISCGLYSSEGRKKFESDTPQNGSLSLYLRGCQSLNSQQIIYRDLSLNPLVQSTDSLLYADENLELWQRRLTSEQILIRSKIQYTDVAFQFCDYILPSQEVNLDQFINELVNFQLSTQNSRKPNAQDI